MKAIFYNNKSDERYMNKNLETLKWGQQEITEVPIQLIEPCDVIRPRLKLSSDLVTKNCNYVQIEELGRYYFIRSWTTENGYIYVDCEVDVLYTFRTYIQKENVIVARQRDYYDRYLEDDKIKVENYECVRTLQFPQGFSSLNIILGVVGKTSTSNS